MPHITVKMYPGESEEQKVKLAEELTKTVMDLTGKPDAAISVRIVEVPENEWMETVYEREIRPEIDALYKKPGY
ncbi:MAG: 4-oxalocrotonate tautomerase [Pedobacter sp.]|nr:MAG: 4-oxalocrotonate tautomerase [Pedobacter sp.]